MTKQEVIQEAYRKYWEDVRVYINQDGWLDGVPNCHHLSNAYNQLYDCCDKKHNMIRPKSLQGIETNNDWIKIESEADLPKTGEYDMSSFKLIYWTNNGLYYSEDYKRHKLHYESLEITHYQLIPIEKPKPPIY